MFSREAAKTKFIVFGLTQRGLEYAIFSRALAVTQQTAKCQIGIAANVKIFSNEKEVFGCSVLTLKCVYLQQVLGVVSIFIIM